MDPLKLYPYSKSLSMFQILQWKCITRKSSISGFRALTLIKCQLTTISGKTSYSIELSIAFVFVMEDELLRVVLEKNEHFGYGFSVLGVSGLPHVIYDILEDSPAQCEEVRRGEIEKPICKELMNANSVCGYFVRFKWLPSDSVCARTLQETSR